MIKTLFFPKSHDPHQEVPLDQVPELIKDPQNLVWVSLEKANDDEIKQVLQDTFQFHPLTIEDCQSSGNQPPKVDDFGSYIFIIAHAVEAMNEIQELVTQELDIFLGSNFVVTCFRDETMPPVEFLWQRINRDNRLHENGSDFLCHALLDKLVDDYMPLIDQMEEEIEQLEDLILSHPKPQALERILNLKHSILALRRIVGPQREIMNSLSRDDFPMIDRQSRVYFRDIYDHLVRIQDLSDTIRDIISGAMDIYLNSTSLRLNEVMKALTIVSTIFLPLTFVAGVYGMNFQHMPEIPWRFGYLFVWVIFVSIFVGMITFFKKRGWF
jgi:magnesium transporter